MTRSRLTAKPPNHLAAEGRRLWRAITADFQFGDPASLELLEKGCTAADRAAEARALIARDGIVTTSGKGGAVRHPAVVIERDSVATMVSCFKLLGLHHDHSGAGRRPGT